MKKKFLFAFTTAVITTAFISSCNSGSEKKSTEDTAMVKTETEPTIPPVDAPKDVVDIAMASADHSTLVAAVKAAGLAETLKGAGPFTIFAPTNAAFSALPAGTVDGLLKPEKKDDLTKILTFHVVSGSVKSSDLKDGQKVKTLQGEELSVAIKDGKVSINGANVTAADLTGSNGVIHVIDAVLMPKK